MKYFSIKFFAGLLAVATIFGSLSGGLKLAPVCVSASTAQSCAAGPFSGSSANTAQPTQNFVLNFSQRSFAANFAAVSNQQFHFSSPVNNKSPPLEA